MLRPGAQWCSVDNSRTGAGPCIKLTAWSLLCQRTCGVRWAPAGLPGLSS